MNKNFERSLSFEREFHPRFVEVGMSGESCEGTGSVVHVAKTDRTLHVAKRDLVAKRGHRSLQSGGGDTWKNFPKAVLLQG